jgi:glycosyltransferase involved in cell wall biosynthesis
MIETILDPFAVPVKREDVVALVWVDRAARAWNVTIASLLQNPKISEIHVGFTENQSPSALIKRDPRVIVHDAISLVDLAKLVFERAGDFVLCCTWPGKPSPETFDVAIECINNDPRIGTVSFISNAAGAFSFPYRNTGSPFGVEGHDEVTLTHLLRQRRQEGEGLTPIQVPDGAMVLVNTGMWDVCGEIDCYGTQNLALALADLAMRAAKRGFNSYLDTSGYISMPFDDVEPFQSILLNANARHVLHGRFPYFPMNYDVEASRPNSVLGEALDLARARATGLRVLIDGSALGPKEMGTQVLTLKLSLTLAERDDVQAVIVGVPDPDNLPVYAQDLAKNRKVRIIAAGDLDFPGAPDVDILHRPYQPSSPIPWDRWRSIAKRSVITVQDLIAYRNPSYFADCAAWLSYRDNLNRQIAQVDGVISISHDVVAIIGEEHIPVDPARIHVVENGADARSKDQLSRIPDAMLDRGWAGIPFVFVLGATYAHKNRDLAMRVWASLRAKGYPHKLIMAGAAVPQGSLRVEESLLSSNQLDPHVMTFPEVSSEERNWLMANASLVLYPTAAEGFGLVPFEAACLDVPTLFVSFGPLRELTDDPELPVTFSLGGLVARAQDLLDDPTVARASIAGVLKNLDSLTWAETGRKAVESYFATLAQPARMPSI